MTAPNATGASRANDCPGQDQTNCAITLIDLDIERKAFASMAARLALDGYSLHELAHGGYLVSRWDRTFHSNDLAGVRVFCHSVVGAV
jgi:hypothetical protein